MADTTASVPDGRAIGVTEVVSHSSSEGHTIASPESTVASVSSGHGLSADWGGIAKWGRAYKRKDEARQGDEDQP